MLIVAGDVADVLRGRGRVPHSAGDVAVGLCFGGTGNCSEWCCGDSSARGTNGDTEILDLSVLDIVDPTVDKDIGDRATSAVPRKSRVVLLKKSIQIHWTKTKSRAYICNNTAGGDALNIDLYVLLNKGPVAGYNRDRIG